MPPQSLAGTHFAPSYRCTSEKQRRAGCQPGLGLSGVTSGTEPSALPCPASARKPATSPPTAASHTCTHVHTHAHLHICKLTLGAQAALGASGSHMSPSLVGCPSTSKPLQAKAGRRSQVTAGTTCVETSNSGKRRGQAPADLAPCAGAVSLWPARC